MITKLKSHPNIVRVVDFIPSGQIIYPHGRSKQVECVLVEELASGGELYYYVANVGFFSEP